MISDAEFYFWIVAGILGWIAFGAMWLKAKRESEKCVEWMAE